MHLFSNKMLHNFLYVVYVYLRIDLYIIIYTTLKRSRQNINKHHYLRHKSIDMWNQKWLYETKRSACIDKTGLFLIFLHWFFFFFFLTSVSVCLSDKIIKKKFFCTFKYFNGSYLKGIYQTFVYKYKAF